MGCTLWGFVRKLLYFVRICEKIDRVITALHRSSIKNDTVCYKAIHHGWRRCRYGATWTKNRITILQNAVFQTSPNNYDDCIISSSICFFLSYIDVIMQLCETEFLRPCGKIYYLALFLLDIKETRVENRHINYLQLIIIRTHVCLTLLTPKSFWRDNGIDNYSHMFVIECGDKQICRNKMWMNFKYKITPSLFGNR